jgi:hypothetical protein
MPNMFPFDKTRYGGGIAFGGGGGNEGGGGTTNTVQKADPWEGQQPYLTYGFEQAKNQYSSASPTYFPNSTIAPNSNETNLAMGMQANRAVQGSPIQTAATNELTRTLGGEYLAPIASQYNSPQMQAANKLNTDTLNGNYLYGGQGFNAAVDAATRKILPQVNSSFERAGRTGSGLAAQAQTQAIADAFAGQYGQERNNQLQAGGLALAGTNSMAQQLASERENQLRSMFFAPTIANQDYQDISKLSEVGSQKDSLAQNQLNEQINRYNYGQNLPQAKLQDYMNMIQGNYGGTTSSLSNTTSREPSYSNDFGSAMGGLLSIAGLFGGGGGGLFGLF